MKPQILFLGWVTLILVLGLLAIACVVAERPAELNPLVLEGRQEPQTNPSNLNIKLLSFHDEPCWSLSQKEYFRFAGRYFRRKHYLKIVGNAKAEYNYEYWKCSTIVKWSEATGNGCNRSTGNSDMCTAACYPISATAIFKGPGISSLGHIPPVVSAAEEDSKFYHLCKYGGGR